jgi:hypothetical protein
MGLEREGYDEQIERNAAAERVARRDRWRSLGRSLVELLLSIAVGFALIGYSAHTRDEALGRTLFDVGRLAWIAGVLVTLLAAYRRGERRGDW